MSFKVKIHTFEGPLDLLLDLIEKRKLHINDISLAQVADDYIAYINQFEHFPVADSANFVLIASTLVLIKSKSLLPTLSLTMEEETTINDLETRLALYQKTREISKTLTSIYDKSPLFMPSGRKMFEPVFSPHASMNVSSVSQAIKNALMSVPKQVVELPKAIVRNVISLEETIKKLADRVKKSLSMSFRDFSKVGRTEKVNVIISFLAMLELVKQGIIMVRQEKEFGDINMQTEDVGLPTYT